jgi:hypothetical protein
VGASVWDSVGASFSEYSSYIGFSNYGWVSFYDFFTRIGVLSHEKFDKYKTFTESGVFECYEYKNIVFAICPPKTIIKNESGRLHNVSGPAVEFLDGLCYYFINGRSVPAWIFEQKDTITKDKFLKEENSDVRGAIYEVLGQEKMFEMLEAYEVTRREANNETYILYQTKEADSDLGFLKWVGVQCPSTNTKYLLGVPPETTCPLEGVAGTFGFSSSEYILTQNT